jgi:ABC-2 type transport system permease protein
MSTAQPRRASAPTALGLVRSSGRFGPLRALLWSRHRMTVHWVASARHESKLKVAFVSLSAVALWGGAFVVVRFALRMLDELAADAGVAGASVAGQAPFVDLVLARLLAGFALTIFVLLMTSNVLVAFATLFRSRELPRLLISPVPPALLFVGRFVECVSMSSWALAFLGSPALLAYGLHRHAPLGFYLSLVLYYLPFVVLAAAIGTILTLLLTRFFSARRRALPLALGMLGLGGIYLLFRRRLALPDFGAADSLQAIVATLGRTQSPFLPSSWLANGLLAAARGAWSESLLLWAVLLTNALFFAWIATRLAERLWIPSWCDLHASDLGRRARERGLLGARVESLTRALPEPGRSLGIKDLRLFWRDPAQWSQFLIFFGLMALYVANIRARGVFAEEPWRSWISILNTSAAMLVLATLSTRFVFPLISLEGRRFWLLGLAPLHRRDLVMQKFWFSVAVTSLFTVGVALVSGARLRLDAAELGLSLTAITATTFALNGLAIGLGSLFPDFEEESPARIVSGLGGTLNFLASLGYIVLVTLIQAIVVEWRRRDGDGGIGGIEATALAALAAVTLLATWLPLRLGIRHFERCDL